MLKKWRDLVGSMSMEKRARVDMEKEEVRKAHEAAGNPLPDTTEDGNA